MRFLHSQYDKKIFQAYWVSSWENRFESLHQLLQCSLRWERDQKRLFWLLSEFFQGFVNHAQVTLHIDNIRGRNAHHIAETIFKAFGRALRMAVEEDPRMHGIMPSTKGSL
mgnify:CR=1 FL=1